MNKPSPLGCRAILGRRDVSNMTIRNLLARCAFIFGLALTPVACVRGDAPATSLTIRSTGTDFEGRQTFQLQWVAVSNATYIVQQLNNLSPGEPWVAIDKVTPTDKA